MKYLAILLVLGVLGTGCSVGGEDCPPPPVFACPAGFALVAVQAKWLCVYCYECRRVVTFPLGKQGHLTPEDEAASRVVEKP